MIRVEDNRSLKAMANREDLHVAFTRHRATARMFVQNIDALGKMPNRSVIDKVSARDLGKIDAGLERLRSAVQTKARQIRRRAAVAVQRRREMIRELRFKKRQAEARAAERKQSLGVLL